MEKHVRPRGSTAGEAGFGLVEVLVALVLLTVALLAIAGIALAVSQQTWRAAVRSDQSVVAQEVMERVRSAGFAAASSGQDTVTLRGLAYPVARTVTGEGSDVKLLRILVAGQPRVSPDTFWTRIDRPEGYPTAP